MKDGGAAFPGKGSPLVAQDPQTGELKFVPNSEAAWPGMSLRDYFAGQALAGLATIGLTAELIAETAYSYADALIAGRAKGETG